MLGFQHDGVPHQLVQGNDLVHLESIIGQHLGELDLADGADGRYVGHRCRG